MFRHSLRKSGRWASRAAAVLPLLLGGCIYSFSGGGGFPSSIKTIYIQPFTNNTPQIQVSDELFQAMLNQVPRALGVQVGGRGVSDAILRGKVTAYTDVAQNYRPGQTTSQTIQVLQHEIQITASVQIIDVKRKLILWEGTVTGHGTYQPSSESDEVGRQAAIKDLVNQMLNSAQSQW